MKIQDSVAFVTGANRGLGAAFAKALLAAGAKKVYAAASSALTKAAPRPRLAPVTKATESWIFMARGPSQARNMMNVIVATALSRAVPGSGRGPRRARRGTTPGRPPRGRW